MMNWLFWRILVTLSFFVVGVHFGYIGLQLCQKVQFFILPYMDAGINPLICLMFPRHTGSFIDS